MIINNCASLSEMFLSTNRGNQTTVHANIIDRKHLNTEMVQSIQNIPITQIVIIILLMTQINFHSLYCIVLLS